MLRLVDTSIRLYRRRDWSVAVRLRSYLMIHCKGKRGFRLGAYLNQLDARVTLQDGQVVLLDEYSFVDAPVFEMDYMIHEFSAAGSASLESIQDGAGRLQIEYRIFSFPGQGDPDRIDVVVPLLARGLKSERWARRPIRR
jgi:hypothetical protein